MKTQNAIAAAVFSLICAASSAQMVITSPHTTSGDTPARSSEYTVDYGNRNRRPNNYDYWYYANRNPYYLSPYVMVLPQVTRPAVPAVPKYTDVQYGNLVENVVNAAPVQPASARTSVPSIVDTAGSAAPVKPAGATETHVVDVLDRGLLVLDSFDEIKLRGVDMASENEIDEVTRYYARQGIDTLRRLLINEKVFMLLGTPERSPDGPVLAEVYLADGTQVNRQILELGYGHFDSKDFAVDKVPVSLQAAEQRARNAKVGLFSKSN